ncbi:MAG TPA: hypothetical protein VLK36_16825 [Gaiellaceae bacterium]|nr:hypothetical protein [Gaiellaceae bacterium]
MRIIGAATEDEMIAAFLRAEVDSERYGEKLLAILARDGRGVEVLRAPDPAVAADNRYRRRVLDEHRAYERREGLFNGLPSRVDWARAALTAREVLEIRYIDWDWWLTLSGGSRSPLDAARRIRAGEIAGITADAGDEAIAAAAATSPELIAVTTPSHAPLVLVEGHARLTAYALFPASLPEELEILLGVSDEIAEWVQF